MNTKIQKNITLLLLFTLLTVLPFLVAQADYSANSPTYQGIFSFNYFITIVLLLALFTAGLYFLILYRNGRDESYN